MNRSEGRRPHRLRQRRHGRGAVRHAGSRHRHLHRHGAARRRRAENAAASRALRTRRQRFSEGAGLRRLAERGERRLGDPRGGRGAPSSGCSRWRSPPSARPSPALPPTISNYRTVLCGCASAPHRQIAIPALLARNRLERLVVEGDAKPGDEKKRYSMHSFGAQFAEVRVDPRVGEIRVTPLCRRLCRGAHPQHEDGAQPGDGRHHDGDRHGADGSDAYRPEHRPRRQFERLRIRDAGAMPTSPTSRRSLSRSRTG